MQRDESLILRILELVEDCDGAITRVPPEKINSERGIKWSDEEMEYHIGMLLSDGYLRRGYHLKDHVAVLGESFTLTMRGHDWIEGYRNDMYE